MSYEYYFYDTRGGEQEKITEEDAYKSIDFQLDCLLSLYLKDKSFKYEYGKAVIDVSNFKSDYTDCIEINGFIYEKVAR